VFVRHISRSAFHHTSPPVVQERSADFEQLAEIRSAISSNWTGSHPSVSFQLAPGMTGLPFAPMFNRPSPLQPVAAPVVIPFKPNWPTVYIHGFKNPTVRRSEDTRAEFRSATMALNVGAAQEVPRYPLSTPWSITLSSELELLFQKNLFYCGWRSQRCCPRSSWGRMRPRILGRVVSEAYWRIRLKRRIPLSRPSSKMPVSASTRSSSSEVHGNFP